MIETTVPDRQPTAGLLDSGPQVVLRACGLARAVPWGQAWHTYSAAYWVAMTNYECGTMYEMPRVSHRLGGTLREEVAACILGGFGMPASTGLSAYSAVRAAGLLADGITPTPADIERVLRAPLAFGPSWRHYRFPHQRAVRLAAALQYLRASAPPSDPVNVRDWLLNVPGIGPKTASWAVRNHFSCDRVAILDVHIMRVGGHAGVFDAEWVLPRDYGIAEQFFLAWAGYGEVRPSDLDAVIWRESARRRPITGVRQSGPHRQSGSSTI